MATSPAAARDSFPSGLVQPEGSFRFSLDALLLASFAASRFPRGTSAVSLLDLGCGCGVIGLACLLEAANATAKGTDREPELVAAAEENAAVLGLTGRYRGILCDFGIAAERQRLAEEQVDVVLANMPYRPERSGRLPQSPLRRRALFADESTMSAFLLAAKAALKPGGSFDLVYSWSGRERLFAGLERYGFFKTVVLPVCTAGKGNTFCLVSAGHTMAKTRVLPPLRLRDTGGGAYTPEAVSFCRWL